MQEKERQFFGKDKALKGETERGEDVKAFEEESVFREREKTKPSMGTRPSKEELILKAEKILAEEKEASLEEKVEIIKNYLEKSFVKDENKEKAKAFFLGLTAEKLESGFGKKELNLIFKAITEHNNLLKQMEENNLSEDEIEKFKKQYRYQMLPYRFHQALDKLEEVSGRLCTLFLDRHYVLLEEKNFSALISSFWKAEKEYRIQQLKIAFLNLKIENEELLKRSISETEEEKLIEIKGFEKFDYSEIRGEEFVRTLIKILPQKLVSGIETIKYQNGFDEIEVSKPELGIKGRSRAGLDYNKLTKKYEITFFKAPEESKEIYLKELLRTLFHELGHFLDPMVKDQKDLTFQEQLQIISDWEEVRAAEEGLSSYAERITNQDKTLKKFLQGKEDFADTIEIFLTNPLYLKERCPKRYDFCQRFFEKRFPVFNVEAVPKKIKECEFLIERAKKGEELKRRLERRERDRRRFFLLEE